MTMSGAEVQGRGGEQTWSPAWSCTRRRRKTLIRTGHREVVVVAVILVVYAADAGA
jgi:hypothetical protein